MASGMREQNSLSNIQHIQARASTSGGHVTTLNSNVLHPRTCVPGTGLHVNDPYQASLATTCSSSGKETIFESTDRDAETPDRTIDSLPKPSASTLMNNDLDRGQGSCDREDNKEMFPGVNSAVSSSWCYRLDRCVKDNKVLFVGISVTVTCLVLNWVLMELLLSRLKEGIKQDLILRESTSSRWRQPNVNALMSVYVFEMREQEDGSVVVSEVEPCIYRLHLQKVNVTWYSNSSVSYRERFSLFDTDHSSHANATLRLLAPVIKNNSPENVMNVFTGEYNFNQAYQTFSWNYSRKLPFWKSEEANEIVGTDGSVFQPFLDETTRLTLFFPQLRRKFNLEYSERSTFNNLPVYRFTVPDSDFYNNSKMDDSNQVSPQKVGNGYCTPHCFPHGVYAISSGRAGPSIYISLPHFLGADPYYSQRVGGLQPDQSRHRSFFDVDKVTGITVRQKRRFQVNAHIKFSNRTEVYIPLYWFELSIEVRDDTLTYIERTNRSFKLVYAACICVGVALCISLVALVSRLVYKIIVKRTGSSRYARLTVLPPGRCCRMF